MTPVVQRINEATLERSVELRVHELAWEFKRYAKNTAESVLGMAETVVKARALEPAAYQAFCAQIELSEGSSMIRKLEVIGKRSDELRKYVAVLPARWTTIYVLARLEPDDLAEVADVLTPDTTAPQLLPIVDFFTGRVDKPRFEKAPLKHVPAGTSQSVTIRFSGEMDRDRIKAINEIVSKARLCNAEVETSPDLEALLYGEPANDASAAQEVSDAD